jgi:hypothetical protein
MQNKTSEKRIRSRIVSAEQTRKLISESSQFFSSKQSVFRNFYMEEETESFISSYEDVTREACSNLLEEEPYF